MINIPVRTLLGPGPSMVHPRVLQAMAYPVIGYLDPCFFEVMDEVQDLLRRVFQTQNSLTLPISGTGSAGMEAAISNSVEQGDSVLVAISGFFGDRLATMAERYGAEVTRLYKPWGKIFLPEEIENALKEKPAKIVAMVHAETSTGTLQPLEDISRIVHKHGALFLVDCVTSLGGVRFCQDDWNIDIAYSGSQKCLGCPPGMAPISLNETAEEIIRTRQRLSSNWYLDLNLLKKYWGAERVYHHTIPINMLYALRESLGMIMEEGLENRYARHVNNARSLWKGLQDLGLELVVEEPYRLPSLTTVWIPKGVNDEMTRSELLNRFNVEIAGGFGEFKGKIWRIGLMGYSSRLENVELLLSALGTVLQR